MIIGIMIPHACLCLSIITKLYGTHHVMVHHQPQSQRHALKTMSASSPAVHAVRTS